MGSIHQNHVLGRREGSLKQRAKPMAVHGGFSSVRDSIMLGRSEQYCESMFLRNSANVTANSAATPCHPRNCRHSCQAGINFRTSCLFHDRSPVHDEHTEGGPRALDRGQASAHRRGATQNPCNCVRHGREHCEESEVQAVEENRCYRRGPSVPDTQAGHGHSHAVDDCGCCCGPSTHLGRNDGVDATFDDRMRATGGSPCLSVSEDFAHRATVNGFMSNPSSMSRKVPTKASRTDSTSVANARVSTQASKEQVIFYGWFLKRPTTGNGTPSCSTLPQVAIGGYKSAGMLESDYFESGPIVQRLERWRLRTSDGLEVGLMGMINVAKSVANGFPTALAQCFMIGFPSAWIYMISNFSSEAPSGVAPDLPSSSASPSNAHGKPHDTKDYEREAPLNTVTLEADPVRIILSSSLFIAPDDTRMRTLRRLSSPNDVPSHSGIASDATSVPQSLNSQEGLDKSRNDCDSCYGAINPCNHSPRYEPMLPRSSDVLPEGGGGEHSARLGDGVQVNDNSTIPKEELCGEVGVAVLNTPERNLNEKAQPNIDWGEFLGDGNSRDQDDEARVRTCDEVNILQEVAICGVLVEPVSKDCTCASVSDLELTCPSCCVEVGLDGTKFSAGDSQDRESKAEVNVKDSSLEELSNRVDETAKPPGVVSKDTSYPTRKRPFQELDSKEEADRQSKMLCGTHTSIRVTAICTTGKGTNGTDSDQPLSGGPDGCLMQESAPCTPLQESKKRPRDATETPGVGEEVVDGGLCDCNPNESVVHTDAEQVEEEIIGTRGDSIADEPKDRKRPKKSAGPAVLSSKIHASVVEVLDIGVEPTVDTGTEPCKEINDAPEKDLIVTARKSRKKLRKVAGTCVLRSQSKVSVEKYSDSRVKPKADPSLNLQREHNVVALEYLNSSVSVTRSRRRRVAVTSPSSQSGKESYAVPGVACPDGTGKEPNHVLTSDQVLEEVNDAEHLCKESKESNAVTDVDRTGGTGKELDRVLPSDRELEVVTDAEHVCKETKEVLTNPNKKYHRKSRKYYKGRSRRRKYSKKGDSVEKETSSDHDIRGFSAEVTKTDTHGDSRDSKPLCGEKYIEDEPDHCTEDSREEIPAPVRQKHQHRATGNYYRSRRRKSHGRDSEMQTLGDGRGDAGGSESHGHLEESERVTKSLKGLRKAADRCSSLRRRASPKAPKRGVEEGHSQKRRIRSKASIVPPPPPTPRVLDKTKVPEAFGLKKSRHGRVLVPRLATWRNQSIKYDMDGSIIAIAEGFEGAEGELGTGCYNFKPPSDKEARSMQRKLRKAAEHVRK